jgi:Zn-dependent protease/predicted transcriptional regulator
MFQKKFTLFKLLGFTVSIDASWGIILFLVIWSLAKGLFPYFYEGLSAEAYWLMGLVGAIGLFASIVIHEFSHSIVARKYGLAIRGITLFIFGGVAEMEEEPPNARAEFMMAIAGPIASMLLALFFALAYLAAERYGWPIHVAGVLAYLSGINMLLAAFNMVPAYPTDGGRVLRSILWGIKGDIYEATKSASRISIVFSIMIIFFGFLNLIRGNLIGGIWWVLIGTFLFNAANASYQRLMMDRSFKGKTVRNFMNTDPVTVPPQITLQEFVEGYVYRHHYKMFPIAEEGMLLGIITTRTLKNVPHEKWRSTRVAELLEPIGEENTISPSAGLKEALSKMSRAGLSRLLVTEKKEMVGVVTLKDLLDYLALKMELEEH